jgi:restriction system protein
MPVPDYQTIMLPLMRLANDGNEHTTAEVLEALAATFRLNDQERRERLPSGTQAKFDNRVGWARTFLKKAGLLESTGRGKFRITERGRDILKSNPSRIDNKVLSKFPEFIAFITPRGTADQREESNEDDEKQTGTPEEVLESSYQSLRTELAQDLLGRLKTSTPRFFEGVVVDLLVAMGYGGSRRDAGRAVGQSGDDGIDGIIKEDKLGLDAVYIQAKRWENTVGRPVVQSFAGSLEGQRARKGVLITTSQFSQEARDYVGRIERKIVLIDGEQLAELMIDYGVGVSEVATYTVKRVDLDYFEEE